jgi:hypothetical protein
MGLQGAVTRTAGLLPLTLNPPPIGGAGTKKRSGGIPCLGGFSAHPRWIRSPTLIHPTLTRGQNCRVDQAQRIHQQGVVRSEETSWPAPWSPRFQRPPNSGRPSLSRQGRRSHMELKRPWLEAAPTWNCKDRRWKPLPQRHSSGSRLARACHGEPIEGETAATQSWPAPGRQRALRSKAHPEPLPSFPDRTTSRSLCAPPLQAGPHPILPMARLCVLAEESPLPPAHSIAAGRRSHRK